MASGVSVYNKKYIIYISRDYSSYCTRYYTYSTAAALKLCKCSAVVHCTYIYIYMWVMQMQMNPPPQISELGLKSSKLGPKSR